jgi:predicted ATP-grasp superfamily ATP-dependent carboligase
MRVILLDSYSRMGLACVNALAPANEVIGGAVGVSFGPAWLERSFRSRRFAAFFRYPSPIHDPEGFGRVIVEACRRYRADAVFPASTESAFALSRLAGQLAELPAVFGIEESAKLERYADKWRFLRLCSELGLPTPRTVLPVGPGRDDLQSLSFPVVAKPRAGEASRGLKVLHNLAELEAFLDRQPRAGTNLGDSEYPYIVQEVIAGGQIHDVAGVAERGRIVAILTFRRLLMRSEFGGGGIVNITTHEPELVEIGTKVIGALEWNGAFDLECIRTKEGAYVPLDGNPRVWASTHLAVALGQNMPQLALDVHTTGEVPTLTTSFPAGTLLRWKTPGSLARCFRKPRSVAKIAHRLNLLLMPRRNAVSDANPANYRHLVGMTLDTRAARKRRPSHKDA